LRCSRTQAALFAHLAQTSMGFRMVNSPELSFVHIRTRARKLAVALVRHGPARLERDVFLIFVDGTV